EVENLLESLVNPAQRHGALQPAVKRKARYVEPTPPFQRSQRACPDEMIGGANLTKHILGPRIEESLCDPHADGVLQLGIRARREISAAVAKVHYVELKAAVQISNDAWVEVGQRRPAVGSQKSIARRELSGVVGEAIARLKSWRRGPIKRGHRHMDRVNQSV